MWKFYITIIRIEMYMSPPDNDRGCDIMVKSKKRAMEKMKRNVALAGPEVTAGMDEAEDPVKTILADYDRKSKAMEAGLAESVRTGKHKAGLEKAEKRDSWRKSAPRAGAHYAERADDMTENAMDDYDLRKAAIEKAQDAIKDMPKATRAQRRARLNKYQDVISEEMDKIYGRKGGA